MKIKTGLRAGGCQGIQPGEGDNGQQGEEAPFQGAGCPWCGNGPGFTPPGQPA